MRVPALVFCGTQKPEGSRIRIKLAPLLPDTIYEFRVAYKNACGLSEYSLPSRRAKTNRARFPAKPQPPTVVHLGTDEATVLLDFSLEDQGSEPVTHFVIEGKDTAKGFSREDRVEFKYPPRVNNEGVELNDKAFAKAVERALTYVVKDLVSLTFYQFRARGESLCGLGPWSEFTEPHKTKALDTNTKVVVR